jgi:hypothetical protein
MRRARSAAVARPKTPTSCAMPAGRYATTIRSSSAARPVGIGKSARRWPLERPGSCPANVLVALTVKLKELSRIRRRISVPKSVLLPMPGDRLDKYRDARGAKVVGPPPPERECPAHPRMPSSRYREIGRGDIGSTAVPRRPTRPARPAALGGTGQPARPHTVALASSGLRSASELPLTAGLW